jgi:hypothetical protein
VIDDVTRHVTHPHLEALRMAISLCYPGSIYIVSFHFGALFVMVCLSLQTISENHAFFPSQFHVFVLSNTQAKHCITMASSSSSSVISASLSQSGNAIAVSSLPNHRSSNSSSNSNTSRSLRVLLFQVATGLLQTTLTYRSTETASEAATATGNGIIKVLFVGDTTVAAICEDKVVVWDLTRGVVAYTVPVKKDQRFVDAAAVADSTATPSIAVLVQTKDEKVQIHQFAAR